MTLVSRCPTESLFSPNPASILTLLRKCRNTRNLEQVHTQIIRKGCEQHHYLVTLFISLCISFSSKNIAYATSVFGRVLQPNVFLWNALINGYSHHSSLAQSVRIFIRMKQQQGLSVVPDKYTFPPLIRACSSSLALREGQAIHGASVRHGTENDVFVGSSLIDFYGKCGEVECARKVFDEMTVKNEVSWTAMIVGYVNASNLSNAKDLFDEMPQRNLASWNAMISGLMRFGELESARQLFEVMPERNVVSFTTMIDGYGKAGDMASARFLFDQSPEKDIVSWTALISGYAQNGNPDEAVKLFLEMLSKNVKPDEFIMVSLMSASSQVGCLELATLVDNYMSQGSFNLHGDHVVAALIDMNAKCGNIKRAAFLFEQMPKRDLFAYCSMVQGLSTNGHGAEAVNLFARMLSEGITPDEVAFTVILTACSHAGLVEEACHYFDLMINNFSLSPSPDHYACIIDLLGRSGKLKAAYDIIKSMPVEPHAGAWGALLGACKLHNDIELGEMVAARLFELEPQNAGNFVALSNIYAAADQWLEVSLLRNKMSERGIKKICGQSWIEYPSMM